MSRQLSQALKLMLPIAGPKVEVLYKKFSTIYYGSIPIYGRLSSGAQPRTLTTHDVWRGAWLRVAPTMRPVQV